MTFFSGSRFRLHDAPVSIPPGHHHRDILGELPRHGHRPRLHRLVCRDDPHAVARLPGQQMEDPARRVSRAARLRLLVLDHPPGIPQVAVDEEEGLGGQGDPGESGQGQQGGRAQGP